jgi:CheY-like chemotaxis protein
MSTENETFSSSGQTSSTVILLVEDDAATAELLMLALAEEDHYLPLVTSSGSEALTLAKGVKPDLLICDYHLPDMTGIALYDVFHAQEDCKDIPAIILSASLQLHLQEIQARHLHSLEKPFDLDALLLCVKQALER